MTDSTSEISQRSRIGLPPALLALTATVLILGFIGGAVFTGWHNGDTVRISRETRAVPQPVSTPIPSFGATLRPALTAEDETYAAQLWPIHSQVKLVAVNMTFAGIAYKTGEIDGSALKARLEPLAAQFATAAGQFKQLTAPPSRAKEHKVYADALQFYQNAVAEMIKVTGDGNEEHLLTAQQQSQKASTLLLILSDTLWPGEYKPN